METNLTTKLADYCSSFSSDSLSSELINRSKKHILDFLGACFAGSQTTPAKIISEYVNSLGGGDEASLVGGAKTIGSYAALVNGTSAHCLELDDGHRGAMGHPGSAIIPAALATAEKYGASGKDLITSVVIGYEAMLKIGMAVNPSHRERGFHPTATCGCFGAAVAVGNILDLSRQEMASALGLAGTQASGLFEFLAKGSMIKRLHPGKAAFTGVLSSELASKGFDGPDTILEGENGFLEAFTDGYNLEHFNKLGSPFEIMNAYIKPYPCCRHIHAAIDAVLLWQEKEGLDPNKLDSITVKTYNAASHHNNKNITNLLDAQMSIPYTLAVTLSTGRKPTLDKFDPPMADDQEIVSLMKKIEVVPSEEMESRYPQTRATTVIIEQANNEYGEYAEYPKGSSENPLSEKELREKFLRLTDVFLKKEKSRELIKDTLNLEEIDNISKITTYMPGRK